MEAKHTYDAAQELAQCGWAVFPCGGDDGKRPLTKHWREDSTMSPTRDLFRNGANVAIDAGKSGLVVIDLDLKDGQNGLEDWERLKAKHGFDDATALIAETPSGGRHIIFADPTGGLIGNSDRMLPDSIDVRGNGGYVVAPPSRTPQGSYRWIKDGKEPGPLPPELVKLLLSKPEPKPQPAPSRLARDPNDKERNYVLAALEGETDALAQTPKGNRNKRLNDAALKLGSLAWSDVIDESTARTALYNACVTNGLISDDRERSFEKTFDSGWGAGVSKPREIPAPEPHSTSGDKRQSAGTAEADAATETEDKRPMKDVILDLALDHDITLFTDRHNAPYCRIPRDGHYEILAIDSTDFEDWLSWLLYTYDGHTCSTRTLQPAQRLLRAKAKFQGDTYQLSNRTARDARGALWYDLTNPSWQAVRITPGGWRVIDAPPVLFRRYTHQAPQVRPQRVSAADAPALLDRVFEFVNLTGEKDQLIFTVYLVSLFVPDIAHPIPVLHGEQGSGKTFALKTVRQLVDPSAVSTLSTPWKSDEFVQQLDHHWLAFYDNLNSLSDWQQDLICRAVTGEGHTKRSLYTDDEDVIYTFKRCLALNGINIVTTRPDLLDRSIVWELGALTDKRRTESELEQEFDSAKPRLLGAALEILAGALRTPERNAIQLGRLFRLADWVTMGYRIAEALGNRGNDFVDAYGEAVQSKAQKALELHPLGQAVLTFMEDQDEWEGTPKELLSQLNEVALEAGIDTEASLWPGSVSWIGRRLKEVKPDLRTAGVTYEYERDANERRYTLEKRR